MRILPTYVFHRRTYLPGVRDLMTYAYRDYIFRRCTYVFSDVCVLPTYVSPGDVRIHARILSTYVCYRRTRSIDVRIRDYASEIQIRDYAVGSRGVGTTQNTQDLMKKIAVDSFSGLRLVLKITMTLVIYFCDV